MFQYDYKLTDPDDPTPYTTLTHSMTEAQITEKHGSKSKKIATVDLHDLQTRWALSRQEGVSVQEPGANVHEPRFPHVETDNTHTTTAPTVSSGNSEPDGNANGAADSNPNSVADGNSDPDELPCPDGNG